VDILKKTGQKQVNTMLQNIETECRYIQGLYPSVRPHAPQDLLLIQKDKQGGFISQNILPVAFVPFIGELNTSN
jgi:hypothetical protein